jgi:hypothetical protein
MFSNPNPGLLKNEGHHVKLNDEREKKAGGSGMDRAAQETPVQPEAPVGSKADPSLRVSGVEKGVRSLQSHRVKAVCTGS